MSITQKHQELCDALEALVDANNLSDVLAALAEVCDGKAEHLRSNWQDEPAAKAWQKAANRVDDYAHSVAVVEVS